jgi:hypothetical protein
MIAKTNKTPFTFTTTMTRHSAIWDLGHNLRTSCPNKKALLFNGDIQSRLPHPKVQPRSDSVQKMPCWYHLDIPLIDVSRQRSSTVDLWGSHLFQHQPPCQTQLSLLCHSRTKPPTYAPHQVLLSSIASILWDLGRRVPHRSREYSLWHFDLGEYVEIERRILR